MGKQFFKWFNFLQRTVLSDNLFNTVRQLAASADLITSFGVQFDNRPGLTRRDVIHEAIQVANIADLVRTSSFIY